MPENVGKFMRKLVIATLRAQAEGERNASDAAGAAAFLDPDSEDFEGAHFEELNVCCHGRAAAPDVRAAPENIILPSDAYLGSPAGGAHVSDLRVKWQALASAVGPAPCSRMWDGRLISLGAHALSAWRT